MSGWTKQTTSSSGGTTNKLNGLKWAVLGDSITLASNLIGYDELIQTKTGIIPLNYGVSATTVAIRSGRTDSFLERYVSMDSTADVITVLGGTNDFGLTVALGTLGSTDTTTFYGAYDELVKGLIEKYPTKVIGLMTPMNRKTAPSSLKTYVQAVRDIGEKYGIPVLDMYKEAGLSPIVDYHLNNYYVLQDGLHPNNVGYEIIAKPIKSFLEKIVG